MSYTNQTSNYGLPQYEANDKPTYLGDFNKAMLDIDTNMKTIDSKAISAESNASSANATAQSAQSTAESAQSTADSAQATATQAQTSATQAQSTATQAQSTATQAQNTANSASQTAQTANSNAQVALENSQKLNINTFHKFTLSEVYVGSSLTGVNEPNLYLATNNSKDVFKFYGNIYSTGSKNGAIECYVNSDLRPSQEITIACAGFLHGGSEINPVSLKIGTDGKITFSAWNGSNTGVVQMFIFPCIYFLTNFGDVESTTPNE